MGLSIHIELETNIVFFGLEALSRGNVNHMVLLLDSKHGEPRISVDPWLDVSWFTSGKAIEPTQKWVSSIVSIVDRESSKNNILSAWQMIVYVINNRSHDSSGVFQKIWSNVHTIIIHTPEIKQTHFHVVPLETICVYPTCWWFDPKVTNSTILCGQNLTYRPTLSLDPCSTPNLRISNVPFYSF